MGRITADLQRLATAAEDFQATLKAFEATLSDLDTKLRSNLAGWDGNAKQAYQVFYETWHASARELTAELARLHHTIHIAHHNFRSAKAAHMRMWTL